jgi:hypothetical protein
MSKRPAKPQVQAEPETAKPEAIKNVSYYRFVVYGKVVQPGGIYEPTSADLADEKASKRLANAIRKGYLVKV